jgi:hypothetical protein
MKKPRNKNRNEMENSAIAITATLVGYRLPKNLVEELA